MKNRYLLFVVVLIGTIGFIACSKSSDLKATFLTAKINGTQWKAQTVTCTKVTTTTTITGADTSTVGAHHQLLIFLYNYNNTTGTFKTDDTMAKAGYDYGYADTAGRIVITKADSGYIMGTFSFNTDDGKKITEGSFTAKLPK